ncbi:MAG: hypothetical protein DIJKHBIC_02926 [Thermoanaerobaculia bacterium]|nr:hypothetical protein [Thermoanaerobaculia bacterium]
MFTSTAVFSFRTCREGEGLLDITRTIEEIVSQRDDRGASAEARVTHLASEFRACGTSDPALLARLLHERLVEAARRIDRTSLAVTGLAWLGSGAPSVDQEMMGLVKGTRREIALAAYSVTPGAKALLREMREVVAQGATATLIVNSLGRQPAEVQAFLRETARDLGDRWRLLDFVPRGVQSELHAKVLVVDRMMALVGSANLSYHGMVSNHEMAVVIRGPMAESIAARLDMLAQGPHVRAV